MKWPIASPRTRLPASRKSSKPRSGAVLPIRTRPMPLPKRCGIFLPLRHPQRMTVRFRDEALQDLEEIAGYIARDNPAAAFAVVARIHSVIYDTLDLLPRSGHAAYGAHEFAVPHLPYVIVVQTDAR